MLKHVQLSPYRSRAADTLSLSSNASYSPEPLSSRSSSYSSLSDPQYTTIKVYAKCLRPDIEYKTLSISFQTTCREVVNQLLSKYRMRHRDPNLFYLTMEVNVRSTSSVEGGATVVLDLDDEARPAALQSCHPRGESRFSLQTHPGGLVKIYDSVLMPGVSSQYKSLQISNRTTVDELIQILLNCYNSKERVEQFSLYEVCESQEYQRKLHPDDSPLQVQQCWSPTQKFHFLIRRNRDYRPPRLTKAPWTPEMSIIPRLSRMSLSRSEPTTSYSEYENYFYI